MLYMMCVVFLHRDLVSVGVADNSVDSLCSCLETKSVQPHRSREAKAQVAQLG